MFPSPSLATLIVSLGAAHSGGVSHDGAAMEIGTRHRTLAGLTRCRGHGIRAGGHEHGTGGHGTS